MFAFLVAMNKSQSCFVSNLTIWTKYWNVALSMQLLSIVREAAYP